MLPDLSAVAERETEKLALVSDTLTPWTVSPQMRAQVG